MQEVSPLDIRHPSVVFIEISGSLYSTGSSSEDFEELEDYLNAENFITNILEEEEDSSTVLIQGFFYLVL